MKSENHQDIIKQMADRLREHSVPYKEGAWDRFQEAEKKKSKSIVLWPYFSAAAAVLIAMVLFLIPQKDELEVEKLADHKVEIKQVEPKIETKEKKANSEALLTQEPDKDKVLVAAEKPTDKKENIKKEDIKEVRVAQTAVEPIANNLPVLASEKVTTELETAEERAESLIANQKPIEPRPAVEPSLAPIKKDNFGDFLARLSDENDQVVLNENTDKKWSVGLDISPNMSSNKQVNMGGGVVFAYSVSPKISLSSGVSYLQLGAERGPIDPRVPQIPAYPSPSDHFPLAGFPTGKSAVKTLDKVEASLIGLDIPLAINYHVNKNVYASVGISVFNVINEDRVNKFMNQQVSLLYGSEGDKSPQPMLQTFYSSEPEPEKQYEGHGVSGFYNFSVGYSVPVSKKVGLSIEPFFKIPMNTFRENDMNLSNGGLKISTRF